MGATANSFLMQSFFFFFFLALNSERHSLSFTYCVSLLSDQAMLTFVQIDLIKFKKRKTKNKTKQKSPMPFIYLEHVLSITTSLKPRGGGGVLAGRLLAEMDGTLLRAWFQLP